uniref:DUF4005 domain-containing protein n=1 Tax=Leersia perrieri TaxID=77586 RepID=A0A0D9V8Y1_9ORYZ
MGKKGGWITALKKAFTSSPKDKPTNVQLVAQYSQQHRSDKKRWGFGRSSRQLADPSSSAPATGGGGALINIPLYREPSSIEKILVDAEMDQHRHYFSSSRSPYHLTTPSKPATSLPAPPPPRDDKPAVALPLPPPSPPPLIRRFDHDRQQQVVQHAGAETEWRRPQQQQRRRRAAPARPDRGRAAAAVAIQAAWRGYMARRNYRSLRGLIRLQGVVRGPSVRRQTAHAMRCMQMLVRVQSQVRASRVEAMERRNGRLHHHHLRARAASQEGGIWEDSLLSRDEMDARTKRKVEAVIKRERALAYAYSHQLLKATPMAAHAILADLQSGRSPWWWTPIDRRHVDADMAATAAMPLPRQQRVDQVVNRQASLAAVPSTYSTAAATPARSVTSTYSTATTAAAAAKPMRAAKVASSYYGTMRDDESLTSCPAFGVGGVPNYMTPTVSASAKARARAQMLKRQQEKQAQAAQEKPRFSFGLGQSIGSWAKSPFWGGGGGGVPSSSSRIGTPAASVAGGGGGGRHRSTRSVSELSVDSAVSMPAGLGRRRFH